MSLQPKCASESVHPLPSESMSGICVYPIQGNYPTICASAAGTGDDWKVSLFGVVQYASMIIIKAQSMHESRSCTSPVFCLLCSNATKRERSVGGEDAYHGS